MGIFQLFAEVAGQKLLTKEASVKIGKALRDQASLARRGVRAGGFKLKVDQAGRQAVDKVAIANDMAQNGKTANQAARDALVQHMSVEVNGMTLKGQVAYEYVQNAGKMSAEFERMKKATRGMRSPEGRLWKAHEIKELAESGKVYKPNPEAVRNPQYINKLASQGLFNQAAAADDRARANLIQSLENANTPEPLFSAMLQAMDKLSPSQLTAALRMLSNAERKTLYSSKDSMVKLNLKRTMQAFGIDVNKYADEIEQLEMSGITI